MELTFVAIQDKVRESAVHYIFSKSNKRLHDDYFLLDWRELKTIVEIN